MAIRLDYVVKETGSNLVRNFTLTFAAILTVAVSLAMVAASYLIGQGITPASWACGPTCGCSST